MFRYMDKEKNNLISPPPIVSLSVILFIINEMKYMEKETIKPFNKENNIVSILFILISLITIIIIEKISGIIYVFRSHIIIPTTTGNSKDISFSLNTVFRKNEIMTTAK